MNEKPVYLRFFGVTIFIVSFWFPLKAFFLLEGISPEPWTFFLQLHPLQWVIMATCWLLAGLSLDASPKLKPVAALLFISIGLHYLVLVPTEISSSLRLEGGSGLLLVLLNLPLFIGPVGKILENPCLRWWLIPRRHSMELPVNLKLIQGSQLQLRSFDISNTGIFVKIPSRAFTPLSKNSAQEFLLGTRVTLRISTGRLRDVSFDGVITRWSAHSTGHYPSGLGIHFIGLNKKTTQEITRLVKNHHLQPSYLRPI